MKDYATESLRNRFPTLVGQIWFELALDAYRDAFERDWEWRMDRIVDQIVEQAMVLGVPDPGGECWDCKERKFELHHDTQCHACMEREEQRQVEEAARKAAHEAWWASLPPEERARITAEEGQVIRLMIGGLIARDVQ